MDHDPHARTLRPITVRAPASTAAARAIPAVRRIGPADLRAALAAGLDDFLAAPTQILFLGILYPLVGLIAARATFGGDVMQLLYPLVAGLGLLGPVAATGLYEISRRREAGGAVGLADAFAVRHNPAIRRVAAMGAILLALFVLWLLVAQAIWDTTLGTLGAMTLETAPVVLFGTPEGRSLILWGNLAGVAFSIVVLSLSVVSIPLLLDRDVPLRTAIGTSLRAVAANPGTMVLWGLIVMGVLALGCLPAFIGLAVALPVLGHATWHLYRRTVV
jgi:uncharacterized membrane protein